MVFYLTSPPNKQNATLLSLQCKKKVISSKHVIKSAAPHLLKKSLIENFFFYGVLVQSLTDGYSYF